MIELVGHKILALEVCEGEKYLRFITDNGNIVYEASGDCCSETWFSEILNLDFLIGHTVTEVVDLYLEELNNFKDTHCRQEYDKFYGYRIATEAGHTTIVFRNSSNGYYGGSCILLEPKDQTAILEFTLPDKRTCWLDISDLSEWTAYEPISGSLNRYLKLKAFW